MDDLCKDQKRTKILKFVKIISGELKYKLWLFFQNFVFKSIFKKSFWECGDMLLMFFF